MLKTAEIVLPATLLFLSATLIADSTVEVAGPGENIALHRTCAFVPAPNYPLCSDPDDTRQLTDGLYSTGPESPSIWTMKSTVGWQFSWPIVTIDLGAAQAIGGVAYSTAAGHAGVNWPRSILILTSDDAKVWQYEGDLVEICGGKASPPDRHATYRYVTTDLKTHGRYVAVAVTSDRYIFCDEIEVYRDRNPSSAQKTAGEKISGTDGIHKLICDVETRKGMMRRLNADWSAIRASLAAAKLPLAQKETLEARLRQAKFEVDLLPHPDADQFRAVIPFNPLHEKILSVRGALWQAQGMPELVVWKKHRYDHVAFDEIPSMPFGNPPSLEVELMQNEFRMDAFLITNASEKPIAANIQIEGLPETPKRRWWWPFSRLDSSRGSQPSWLRLAAVPWTDTAQGRPVADALPDAEFKNGQFRILIPAGLTRKVWLTIDSSRLSPGRYRGTLVVQATDTTCCLPFAVNVSAVKMERPTLSLGMYDYTSGQGHYGITRQNRNQAMDLMGSHFVDTPCGAQEVLSYPSADDFDGGNRLKHALTFEILDEWVHAWKTARNYLVYADVGDHFAGARMNTPAFDARVGAWAAALTRHLRELKIDPKRFFLLLVDEPHTDEQDAIVAAWGRAIKRTVPELSVYTEMTWDRPDQTRIQEAITLADMVCPNTRIFQEGGQPVARYFAERRRAGQQLWFYLCEGPTRFFHPSRYYRQHAWHAFSQGATGIGFWSFGDTGGAKSSWNEYTCANLSYAPAFLSPDSVTDSIHWQAVREGIEDYEYLAMLRQMAKTSQDPQFTTEAENVLAQVLQTALENYQPECDWSQAVDSRALDAGRLRVLKLLEKGWAR